VAGISIALDSPGSASANATVYDVRGARVREVWNGRLINGRTIVAWDGNDDQGRPVAAGVYFVRATAGSHSAVQKIVRLH
jgi:flagellar hook assembly protein FlgD